MHNESPRDFSEQIAQLDRLRKEIAKVVVGQESLVERLIIALLSKGHVLIEGVPGLAKTLTVSTLARTIRAQFNRIQFTPDLLPGDLIGTLVFNPQTGEFTPRKGPIFTHILLTDEINRSPAKVQSALLEAMQERQVSLGDKTHKLEEPFMVLATQNPIEQEGTYQLPEAQMDRFFFKLRVGYPSLDEEHLIMKRMATSEPNYEVDPIFTREDIIALRRLVDGVFIQESLERYILQVVDATRHPDRIGLDFGPFIRHGASPRAGIFLVMAARAHALMKGRDYVVPGDIRAIALDVLRHRVALTYKAEAQALTSETIIEKILDKIPPP